MSETERKQVPWEHSALIKASPAALYRLLCGREQPVFSAAWTVHPRARSRSITGTHRTVRERTDTPLHMP
jgi:hypothetical protein